MNTTETKPALLDCGHPPSPHSSFTTGYGQDSEGKTFCYECFARRDTEQMIRDGKITLYLTEANKQDTAPNGFNGLNGQKVSRWQVTNWPASLKFNAYVTKGRHNIAGTRYDAYFTGPNNTQWHGVTIGDNTQLCHCKRLKS